MALHMADTMNTGVVISFGIKDRSQNYLFYSCGDVFPPWYGMPREAKAFYDQAMRLLNGQCSNGFYAFACLLGFLNAFVFPDQSAIHLNTLHGMAPSNWLN